MFKKTPHAKRRFIIGMIVLAVMALIWFSGIKNCLTFDYIKTQSEWLRMQVEHHYWQTVFSYLLAFVIVVIFCLPGAAVMTIVGGYLFGVFFGVIYLIMGATIGATIFFLVVRYLLGTYLQMRFASRLVRFNQLIAERGWLFLLMLRCLPLIPFAMVNILAGLTNIKFWTFVWTTMVGVIPTGIIFTYAGRQLGAIKSLNDIFTPPILVALVLLMIVVCLPVIINRYKKIF